MTALEYQDLPEKVYLVIKEMIMRGDLTAGQKLVQEDLAERLGVSRTPILSALTKLEKELLVEIIPRRGAFVKRVTLKELRDIYDIRVRLEPLGACEAARHATREDVGELDTLLNEFHQVAEGNQMRQILELDYRLHMAIHRMSRNELLYRMMASYSLVVLSNITRFLRDPLVSYSDHLAVVEAIRSGDCEQADARMREHLIVSRVKLDDLNEEDYREERGGYG